MRFNLKATTPTSAQGRWHLIYAGALFLILAATFAVYRPGLAGGFVFDDFANLPALGRYGGVHDLRSLLWYLTSGIADPAGRPIALLSFLVDAQDWPAEAFPFKRTNLCIHLLNGILLWSVLRVLGRRILPGRESDWTALGGAALWVLHPLWVSTVLYVIQRQAMLAATFTLVGILAWNSATKAFEHGRTKTGWSLAILAVPVCGSLAGLSKANGFLLPLLIWMLDATVMGRQRAPAIAHGTTPALAHRILLYIPGVAILAGTVAIGITAAPELPLSRGWTLLQRLMTEPRVLFDYLRLLLIPRTDTSGVFADDVRLSTDILHPWTTLPAIAGLALLAVAAWRCRHRWPIPCAATLFFLAGHVMESSFIGLELYFEHRNYLPAMIAFWPLAYLCVRAGPLLRYRVGGLVIACGLLALLSFQLARDWSNPLALSGRWAAVNPSSARAQSYAAAMEMEAGHPELAIQRIEPLSRRAPAEAQYAVVLASAYCQLGYIPDPILQSTINALRINGLQADVTYQWLAQLLAPRSSEECARLPARILRDIATASLSRKFPSVESRSRVYYIQGLLALQEERCPAALDAFKRRLDIQRRPETAQSEIILLATHCSAREGLLLLDHYQASPVPIARASTPALRLRDWMMTRDGYWEAEWKRLRNVMEEDVKHWPPATPREIAHANDEASEAVVLPSPDKQPSLEKAVAAYGERADNPQEHSTRAGGRF